MIRNFNVTVNGTQYSVQVEETGLSAGVSQQAAAPQAFVHSVLEAPKIGSPVAPDSPAPVAAPVSAPSGAAGNAVRSPMPGTILGVNVRQGQAVKKGTVLLILEAMKMENEICAAHDGVITAIHVQSGTSVNTGDNLVSISQG